MHQKRNPAILIVSASLLCAFVSCGPGVSSSHGAWTVTLSVDEPGRLAAHEPVLLLIRVRNGTGRPVSLDPVSIDHSTFEVELERPSGTRSTLREGMGGRFGCRGGFEVAAGETVTTYEMLLPEEPGVWTIRARATLKAQELQRRAWIVTLPDLRFTVAPGAAGVEETAPEGWLERFLLGREAFLDPEVDGQRLTQLGAAASPRLRRFVMLAQAMTTVMSHRYSYTPEDEQARRVLEADAELHPCRPLGDVALLGLARIYADLLPWSDRGSPPGYPERELRRVSERLHRGFPQSAVTLGELGIYESRLPSAP